MHEDHNVISNRIKNRDCDDFDNDTSPHPGKRPDLTAGCSFIFAPFKLLSKKRNVIITVIFLDNLQVLKIKILQMKLPQRHLHKMYKMFRNYIMVIFL